MTYKIQNDITESRMLKKRAAQCAAQESAPGDPDEWVQTNIRILASAPGWDAAWESARVSHPEPGYDPGEDEGVITDGMILSQVQAMLAV